MGFEIGDEVIFIQVNYWFKDRQREVHIGKIGKVTEITISPLECTVSVLFKSDTKPIKCVFDEIEPYIRHKGAKEFSEWLRKV